MTCELPKPKVLGPYALAIHQDTGGLNTPQNTRFFVWGFDPRLDVAVMVYWQPEPGNTVPVSDSTNNKWSAVSVVRDGSGATRDLNTIFSSRSLPDGYEFDTKAQGIAFDLANVVFRDAGNGDHGALWLRVEAAPTSSLSPDEARTLLDGLSVQLSKQLLLATLT